MLRISNLSQFPDDPATLLPNFSGHAPCLQKQLNIPSPLAGMVQQRARNAHLVVRLTYCGQPRACQRLIDGLAEPPQKLFALRETDPLRRKKLGEGFDVFGAVRLDMFDDLRFHNGLAALFPHGSLP